MAFVSEPEPFLKVDFPRDGVAHVQINRADKLNAFSQPMWVDLCEIFRSLSKNSSVRAIVLSGAGERAFSAGLDLEWAMNDRLIFNPSSDKALDVARRATAIRRWALEFQECVTAVEKCEKPVVCVLHGISFGISIDISTCADIRICTSDARFSVKEVDIGLAADVGTLARLPKVVGNHSWVKDICLTARQFGAQEALQFGFVSRILPNKDDAIKEALEQAVLLASKSPVAVQGTKNFLDWSRDHSVADTLTYTAVWNAGALQTQDIPLALKAGRLRAAPQFAKL